MQILVILEWRLTKKHSDIIAFAFHDGLYKLTRIPFILENAPATFQRRLDVILVSVNWDLVMEYLKDLLVFSKTAR